MGPKISIDSATLMNKGLEVIEARWLFDAPPEQIDVVVHPQSIVHSLVEFVDGSVLTQLGLPDMRVPIAVALAHPERLTLDLPRLELAEFGKLDFETPDREKFPCLQLAFDALAGSEEAPAVLGHHRPDFFERVEDAGGRLAVHDRHVAHLWIRLQDTGQLPRIDGAVLRGAQL